MPQNTETTPVLIGERENMNEIQQSIAKCSLSGNTVYLPSIESGLLPNYAQVRKAFLDAGATYKRNCFIFPNDARPYIERLMSGEILNTKKEFQYFQTPENMARKVVSLADINDENLSILEPNGGQGALMRAVWEILPKARIHTYELMDIKRMVLEKLGQLYTY